MSDSARAFDVARRAAADLRWGDAYTALRRVDREDMAPDVLELFAYAAWLLSVRYGLRGEPTASSGWLQRAASSRARPSASSTATSRAARRSWHSAPVELLRNEQEGHVLESETFIGC